MNQADSHSPRRQLSLFDSTCIIVGIIVGAGIYETSPAVASLVSSPTQLMVIWLLGGLIALVGALCYAELATTYPSDGGDYQFLSKAFGCHFGFTFAWAEYWIIRPGNVGMMAFVFARFAHDLWPLSQEDETFDFVAYAGGAVVILTALNLIGVRTGKTTQNILTSAKVVGLIAVFLVGVFAVPAAPTVAAEPVVDSSGPDFRLALILVLFTYGGWNEISYVAAEVRDPSRNIVRSLVLGTVAVTLVYLAVNFAFLRALGLTATSESQAAAADVLRLRFGSEAGRVMSALVCVSCLGAINGLLFTGSRVLYAAGADHKLISWLGRWNAKLDTPLYALLLQLAVTLAMVIGFGSEQGFQKLLNFTAPVYWLFATMVGVSLFVLRFTDPDRERPHRVLWYPVTPFLFCLSCLFMLQSGMQYAWDNRSIEAAVTIAVVIAGAVVSLWSGAKKEE